MKPTDGNFGRIDDRIEYFIRGAQTQNFGDYLPELIFKSFFTYPRIDADIFRLVGSVIDDRWIRKELGRINGHVGGLSAFWCCGARKPEKLSDATLARCLFFGVRGPLTRDLLGLPGDTTLGDPGLLAPLFHPPRTHPETTGRTICIPHTHDPKSHDVLMKMAGTDLLVRPEIEASEPALRELLDKIASADFVLSSSLHGAILACAYGRPFAFWDNGHVDIPFKWQDFAGSVNMPPTFVKNLEEGRKAYAAFVPGMKIPPLAPILDVSPFVVRPGQMLRALVHDGVASTDDLLTAAALLDALNSVNPDEVFRLQGLSQDNRRYRLDPTGYVRRLFGRSVRRIKSKGTTVSRLLTGRNS